MKENRVKFTCVVNGDYELSFYSPWMNHLMAEELCSSFDDWSEFIESCFDPKVIYHGQGNRVVDIKFFCQVDVVRYEEEEEMPL